MGVRKTVQRKAVVSETAVRWTAALADAVRKRQGNANIPAAIQLDEGYSNPMVTTKYGVVEVQEGDWIVEHADGSFAVYTDAAFRRIFDVIT